MKLNYFAIETSSTDYLEKLSWEPGMKIGIINKHGIIINSPKFIPSLVDGILYIDSITASFNVAQEETLISGKYIRSTELKIVSFDDVDILLDSQKINIDINTKLNAQSVEYVGHKVPLFKINDLNINKSYDIIFKIINYTFNSIETLEIFYRFVFNKNNNMGDVNGDGVIDILDIVSLSNYLSNNEPLANPEYGDINKRGNMSVYELVSLSNYILNNG